MDPNPRSHALPACFLILLAACGGGGGGGGGPIDVAFESFSTIRPNERATMIGISQTASGATFPGPGGFLVNSVVPGPLDSANSRTRVTYDANRNLSAFDFSAPQSSASFGSGVDCSGGAACVAETANSVGVLGNPSFPSNNWNYQTFGVWLVLPSSNTIQIGAISAGVTTPFSAIPTGGPNAIFTGFTSGFYVNEIAVPFFSSANLSATVDWSARSIAFSTSNTTIGNLNTGMITADDQLNLMGTLTYGSSNQFTGPVSATRNALGGNATGRFYGPAAQEMGGVYSLQGNAGSSLVGAFGARRP